MDFQDLKKWSICKEISADLFAQDYMKMRKKQLRVEYQKKIDLINTLTKNQDSLSSSNIKLKSNLLTLKKYLNKTNDSILSLKSKNEIGKDEEIIQILSAQDENMLREICTSEFLSKFEICSTIPKEKVEEV